MVRRPRQRPIRKRASAEALRKKTLHIFDENEYERKMKLTTKEYCYFWLGWVIGILNVTVILGLVVVLAFIIRGL